MTQQQWECWERFEGYIAVITKPTFDALSSKEFSVAFAVVPLLVRNTPPTGGHQIYHRALRRGYAGKHGYREILPAGDSLP